jgi:hypothetical protein
MGSALRGVAECRTSRWLAVGVTWLLVVLLRLAHLGVSNAFALLRLLPMSDRDKDAEILALCHRLAVLQWRRGSQQVRFAPSDRAIGGVLHRMPRCVLTHLHLVVKPFDRGRVDIVSGNSPSMKEIANVAGGDPGH